MADRIDVNGLKKEITQRRDGSPYSMDEVSFYNFALDALVIIADTLVDIKRELDRGSFGG